MITLSSDEHAMLSGAQGEAIAMAMRIVTGTARALGAKDLIAVTSAHIDGCLYHGDSGTLFAEALVARGGRVAVPATLNVGALDLVHAGRVRLPNAQADMARRMMQAYITLGCQPTWTCAPYQAGHRPSVGEDVAWGESNAVAFCNSVLGARTNRYGDFLDICAAITGRAPRSGLHLPENRRATLVIDASSLPRALLQEEATFAAIGAWLGRHVGDSVAAFKGLGAPNEDQLKALGAAAASTGAVGLFHVVGVTPEAATLDSATGGGPAETIALTPQELNAAAASLSTVALDAGADVDIVAIGSPHLSLEQIVALDTELAARPCKIPLYACTGRHVLNAAPPDMLARLEGVGVVLVADTCIVVTPILPSTGGVLATNSGKFAHYTKANTGYEVVFSTLRGCVNTAISGKLDRGFDHAH